MVITFCHRRWIDNSSPEKWAGAKLKIRTEIPRSEIFAERFETKENDF